MRNILFVDRFYMLLEKSIFYDSYICVLDKIFGCEQEADVWARGKQISVYPLAHTSSPVCLSMVIKTYILA